ncbi:MAG: hypothetical protein A3D20_07975 [Nitrospinae bacterium RIFCSPHIGHO2_02_FULL_39_82]|nr:MAG: hypothetical protein A3D20_07975 [Nitrospinae bacterium RIFCSPHIGHO2_02_FULL_39_82]OGW08165.1 MAG: hypothetical protein A2W75_03715 [Nitrospinae bacterium RIFCSPLOWO2_12_39_15]
MTIKIYSRKMLKRLLTCFLLFTFCFLVIKDYAFASGPFIGDISVIKSSENIAFSARLKGGITKDIVEIINSGAPTTFTYYIQLVRHRSGWFDSVEYSKTIKRSVKYNVLTKEYKFGEDVEDSIPQANKKNNVEKVTKDFDELKKWLANLESISLIPSKQIAAGDKYYISIKADLKTISLWFPFNYILFFVSFWDITTDWEVSSPFTAD